MHLVLAVIFIGASSLYHSMENCKRSSDAFKSRSRSSRSLVTICIHLDREVKISNKSIAIGFWVWENNPCGGMNILITSPNNTITNNRIYCSRINKKILKLKWVVGKFVVSEKVPRRSQWIEFCRNTGFTNGWRPITTKKTQRQENRSNRLQTLTPSFFGK